MDGKLPEPEKLADLIALHAFEVEALRQAQGKKDWILDIAVLPDRGHDALNHLGIAKEIALLGKNHVKPFPRKKARAAKGSLPKLKVSIRAKHLVPRYTAVVIEGIEVTQSPLWLKERLKAVGVNSINNIVDIANYVMLDIGQPLHAFDFDAIQGNRMVIRESRENEKIEVLDGSTLTLPQGALVIDDAKRVIDLAGIKGGRVSGITEHTKNIVLQAANFDGQTIYNTKKKLQYASQAANIYSYGLDSSITIDGIERALALLEQIGLKGKVVQVIDMYPRKRKPMTIGLNMEDIESILGISIPEKTARDILKRIGCTVKPRTKHAWQVTPPQRRLDLKIPEDLIAEIGRIHGYEKIKPEFIIAPFKPPEINFQVRWQERIKDSFREAGYTEVYNYSFIGKKDLNSFAYSNGEQKALLELQNPLSEDYQYLRGSLLENLVKNIASNQRAFSEIRIFEIGKVFGLENGKVKETLMLGAMIQADNPFYEMKGMCDFLLNSLGITSSWYDEYEATPNNRPVLWHQGRSAEIKIDSVEIGFLGEISPRLALNLKIAKPLGALHIHLDKLILMASEEKEYSAPSKFPASTRDIAIAVPLQTKVAEVMNIMESAGGKLVEDIDLFDMYEGENLQEHKKSLAFHIVYQADDRTLTGKEVDTLHNQIIKAVEENPEWEVRK